MNVLEIPCECFFSVLLLGLQNKYPFCIECTDTNRPTGGVVSPTSAAFTGRSEEALQSLHFLSACVGFFSQIVQFSNN